MSGFRSKAASWGAQASVFLSVLSILIGVIAFLPLFSDSKATGLRVSLFIVFVLAAILSGYCVLESRLELKRSRAKEISEVNRRAEEIGKTLLHFISTECVSKGDARVTLFREGHEGNEIYFYRVVRLASHSDFTGGGRIGFAESESVMQGIANLALGVPNSHPVDVRPNFPERSRLHSNWENAQVRYVGKEGAASLRMATRSYGWRRISPIVYGESPHVVLVESTDPDGVNQNGLKNSMLDPIAHALVKANRPSL